MTDLDFISEKTRQMGERLNDGTLGPAHPAIAQTSVDPFVFGLSVFVFACFIGYYVVWRVTPALHTPLMSVTNAISGIIIVGALIAVGPAGVGLAQIIGFIAIVIASINIFGGFIVTGRMLEMFRKKPSYRRRES